VIFPSVEFLLGREVAIKTLPPDFGDDGRELFYGRGNDVLAIPVTPGAGFAFGTPRTLFAVNFKAGQGAGFLVTDKGQRILTNELPQADPGQSGARLIQHWSTAVAAR